MEDLTREDLVQLLVFYKNKNADLEFSYLTLQINNKKLLDENKKEYEKLIVIKNQTNSDLIKRERDSNSENVKFLKKEIEKRDKQIEKYKATSKKS
jgi:hypothetical protein